jgi:hypothetical protein
MPDEVTGLEIVMAAADLGLAVAADGKIVTDW